MEPENNNWLQKESDKMQELSELPKTDAMKFEEGRVEKVEVDFTNPFEKVQDSYDDKVTKAVIPVIHEGKYKVWWLNIRNPTYHDLVKEGLKGKTSFEIIRTGEKKNTRFTILERGNEKFPEQ